jgi:hypothetical protein
MPKVVCVTIRTFHSYSSNRFWASTAGIASWAGRDSSTMAAYVLETVLMCVYPQRVYPFASSKSRFARPWPSSVERFRLPKLRWRDWRLLILITGLTLLASLSLIVVSGGNEFASLLRSLASRGGKGWRNRRRPDLITVQYSPLQRLPND